MRPYIIYINLIFLIFIIIYLSLLILYIIRYISILNFKSNNEYLSNYPSWILLLPLLKRFEIVESDGLFISNQILIFCCFSKTNREMKSWIVIHLDLNLRLVFIRLFSSRFKIGDFPYFFKSLKLRVLHQLIILIHITYIYYI